ncbi:hypothetical protein DPMN_058678 [Dreissena polymorpha]|uniref:N(6)-L-threonylcarbamoyladenine synthase n=3 Tax=Dreissena polymorpha TaxID=45954 RepID=A0A9D4C269_DREPO|nr:hypothetical protein DPMN_058678 [Dreissena polymorpha]
MTSCSCFKRNIRSLVTLNRDVNNTNKGEIRARILGIETSCDDTGAAVVNEKGEIIGNALHSQTETTVSLGGVLPQYAKALHKKHIDTIVKDALQKAQLHPKELDAVAVTVEPGMPLSLEVGLSYAKQMVLEHGLPMIPIHHMEAHALTARMVEQIDFPFLVFLASGGHCLLAVARDVDDFLLLGNCTDCAPGDAFDKVARRLKLKTLPECTGKSGGAMIEHLSRCGNRDTFNAPDVFFKKRSCNFSFHGIKSHYMRYILEEESKQGIEGSGVISNASDLCASFQYAILRHMCRPLQRALVFCDNNNLLAETKTVVLSGGVACNRYLRHGIEKVCVTHGARLVVPPPELCTDNGIMIAWNGIEKYLCGRGFVDDPQSVCYRNRSPLGTDITEEVTKAHIKVKLIDLGL